MIITVYVKKIAELNTLRKCFHLEKNEKEKTKLGILEIFKNL